MNGVRKAWVGILMMCSGAVWAVPVPETPPPEGMNTSFAVLVGFPSTEQAGGSGALLVPGTVIPLTDEPAASADRGRRPMVEKSLSFSRAAEKLWSTFRLDPSRRLQQGKIGPVLPDRPVELPMLAEANVRITATLLRYDNANATFRVVFKQGDKILADSTAHVARGGRAVVGGMDGAAAPYIFVFIEPETAAAEAPGTKSPLLPPGITEPKPISHVQPKYPLEAKNERVQGVVVLNVLIDESGNVLEAAALEDPDPRLTKSAIEAVRQWKFQPALDDTGKPIKVHASVTINFKLK